MNDLGSLIFFIIFLIIVTFIIAEIGEKICEITDKKNDEIIDEKIYEPNIEKIDDPHIVYYVKVDNGSLGFLYKIGITKHDVHTRFSSSERDVMTVIKEWKFDSRMEARLYEDSVLKRFSDHKYQGPNVLDSGNTELFTRDVMGLDVAA